MTVARRKAAHAKRDAASRTSIPTTRRPADRGSQRNRQAGARVRRRRKTAEQVEKGKLALRHLPCHYRACHDQKGGLLSGGRAVLEGEDRELLGKAQIELASCSAVTRIENMSSDHLDSTSGAGEQAARHMKKKKTIFPRLRHSRLDLIGTGRRMAARKTATGDGTYRPQADAPSQARSWGAGLAGPAAKATARTCSVDRHSGQGDTLREAAIPDDSNDFEGPDCVGAVGAGARRSRPAGRDGRHL